MSVPPAYTAEQVKRAARVYATNEDAGRAIGMTGSAFGRACRRLEIESPYHRKVRERGEMQTRREQREMARS